MSPALSLGGCSSAPAARAEMKISMQWEGGSCSSAEGLCAFNMLTDRTAACAMHDGEAGGRSREIVMLPPQTESFTPGCSNRAYTPNNTRFYNQIYRLSSSHGLWFLYNRLLYHTLTAGDVAGTLDWKVSKLKTCHRNKKLHKTLTTSVFFFFGTVIK